MDRNLALELVRVTESAALVSSGFMGKGDKNGADGAAVEAMRKAFESVKINGEVVIGEGELDEAPMLYVGEKVGMATDDCMEVDIAVDPLDGTTLIAKGLPNAIAVIAMGSKGSLLNAPDTYMKKIIVGPKAKGCIDLNKSAEENIINVAKALGKKPSQMTITVQDRERHDYIVDAARKLGARIKMFGDGDVATGIATCFEDTGIDMLMGIGGGPEGVITAAAIKCMGGDMQAQIYPLSDQERERCHEMGFSDEDIQKVLTIEDLAKGDDLFFAATGITEGDLLKGVRLNGNNQATTQSVVMRAKTGTIRFVDAIHNLNKNELLVELMAKYEA
ncbi:class II fructose-bisphosphatase [Romboutsia weinsteinii]|uniref:Fructose-1,6-bisphosphatase n=1 Tax=Romboutsia weinsteinii TaxID=2020949 RepID=A0A371J088_9FIRM|nr:class II fructose-bisphosphatase [Romboutsia weinsteinii]RDY26087.1 class II fructose-bisphosphatase [Romboutsia weinsteinii]